MASLLSAPETDAGILAVPDRIYGSGPIGAIYQAKFLKYLEHRGLKIPLNKPFTRSSATVKWTNRIQRCDHHRYP